MTKITSLEVAARAGVSQSAVSRVFTPGASASAKTAEKVRRAATELGYRPNVLARAMVSGKSRIIGLVVAYLDNQFYPMALERTLERPSGARLSYPDLHCAQLARGHRQRHAGPDGLSGRRNHRRLGLDELPTRQPRKSGGHPRRPFQPRTNGDGFSNVTSANRDGGRKIAEFLLAGGHQRIAHIAGWQGSSTGRDRQSGFLDALSEADVTPVAVVDGMYNRETAMDCAYQIIDAHRPDAIFVGNDHMAFAVLDVLRETNLAPGQDISIVGYDDVPLAAWAAYDLTTYRQPVNRMVDATVDLILTQIETQGATPRQIEIDGKLILRGSARIPEGWHA